MINTVLMIEGIGSSRKKALIKKFGSVLKMQQASLEELESVVPSDVAINLKKYLEEKYSEEK